MDSAVAALKQAFVDGLFTFEDDVAVQQCLKLLKEFTLTAVEISESYELFALDRKLESKVTVKTLRRFEGYLKKTLRQRASVTDLTLVIKQQTTGRDVASGSATPVAQTRSAREREETVLLSTGRRTPPPRDPSSEDVAPYLTAGKTFSARKKV